MIKLLHAADLHLDAPLQGWDPAQTRFLRETLLSLPEQIAALCRRERCQMLLLSGDIFDGPCSPGTLQLLKDALEETAVPVFLSPGNHDFVSAHAPWLTEAFPGNVHIFTRPVIEDVYVKALDCHVYGAGFSAMDCPGLLQDFHAPEGQLSIGIFHGDPTQVTSPYNPVTRAQAAASGLAYLALGHIHQAGHFTAGRTLCAWPGCPMGKGFDETGEKGVLIATLEDTAEVRFVPLEGPRFYDLACAPDSIDFLLPPVGNTDFYRLTLTGEADSPDLPALAAEYSRFPNLTFRDKTVSPLDVWRSLGEDSFEGALFGRLQETLSAADPREKPALQLAARLCRQLLDGQEVVLP